MSQPTLHHPQHPTRPVDPGPTRVEATFIDQVPGEPPVPITVWRTARTDADAGRAIPTRLAARLVAAYSRPGDAVVDLTDDRGLAAACRTGRRRHHPAWFTDASSLVIGPATPPTDQPTTELDRPDEGEDPLDVGAWFGDDLTDPDLPAPPDNPAQPSPDGSLRQATSLVVVCWPLHKIDPANRVRLAWLLTTCTALLRRGGCLILVVGVPAGMTPTPEDFSPVVSAAANVGLGYLQHIVAVAADTDGDVFVYHISDEELLALAHTNDPQWAVSHLRVHADLLVFSQAQQTPQRPASQRATARHTGVTPDAGPGRRRGGDRRG
jgi:hypothetical protein